jgi:predicted O-methyltransferase YrrM
MDIDQGTRFRIQNFNRKLTKKSETETDQYVSEILQDDRFNRSVAEKGSFNTEDQPFSLKLLAIDMTSCVSLYTLCRSLRPSIVVETGVASGLSSAYILCALDKNNHGQLVSIDVPWQSVKENWQPFFSEEDMQEQPIEQQVGWIIPDYLRSRWQLRLGKSTEQLPPLLNELGSLDIFFHDSEHTYETMLWEFQTAWADLRSGGVLIGHNIDVNDAFLDFCRSVTDYESILLAGLHNTMNMPLVTGAMLKVR